MVLRSDVVNKTNLAAVAGSGTTPKTSSSSDVKNSNATTDAFSTFLKANLSVNSKGEVNEEDLFSALVAQRIQTLKGDEGLAKFKARLAESKNEYRSVEEATKWTLLQMQEKDEITYEEGNQLHSEAFEAAQLDSNKEILFDGVGDANDPTKAVDTLERALLSARTAIEAFDNDVREAQDRPVSVINTGMGALTSRGATPSSSSGGITVSASTATPSGGLITPRGTLIDGAGGFLFKPVSENEGKLAVLSPDGIGPLIESMKLLDKDGNVIEEGRFTSFGDDGKNRAKFAFRNPGSSYEKDISVEVRYINGTVQTYKIPDPSQRYD